MLLSLCAAMKNPVPHLGQLLFLRSNLSPFFSKSFHAPFVGGPFFAGALSDLAGAAMVIT